MQRKQKPMPLGQAEGPVPLSPTGSGGQWLGSSTLESYQPAQALSLNPPIWKSPVPSLPFPSTLNILFFPF